MLAKLIALQGQMHSFCIDVADYDRIADLMSHISL